MCVTKFAYIKVVMLYGLVWSMWTKGKWWHMGNCSMLVNIKIWTRLFCGERKILETWVALHRVTCQLDCKLVLQSSWQGKMVAHGELFYASKHQNLNKIILWWTKNPWNMSCSSSCHLPTRLQACFALIQVWLYELSIYIIWLNTSRILTFFWTFVWYSTGSY